MGTIQMKGGISNADRTAVVDPTKLATLCSGEMLEAVVLGTVGSCPREPPIEFICHLSHDIMVDPVTTTSGQTYERAYIERWLASGHRNCPMTNTVLKTRELTPNLEKRKAIEEWCKLVGNILPTEVVLKEAISSQATSSMAAGSEGRSPPKVRKRTIGQLRSLLPWRDKGRLGGSGKAILDQHSEVCDMTASGAVKDTEHIMRDDKADKADFARIMTSSDAVDQSGSADTLGPSERCGGPTSSSGRGTGLLGEARPSGETEPLDANDPVKCNGLAGGAVLSCETGSLQPTSSPVESSVAGMPPSPEAERKELSDPAGAKRENPTLTNIPIQPPRDPHSFILTKGAPRAFVVKETRPGCSVSSERGSGRLRRSSQTGDASESFSGLLDEEIVKLIKIAEDAARAVRRSTNEERGRKSTGLVVLEPGVIVTGERREGEEETNRGDPNGRYDDGDGRMTDDRRAEARFHRGPLGEGSVEERKESYDMVGRSLQSDGREDRNELDQALSWQDRLSGSESLYSLEERRTALESLWNMTKMSKITRRKLGELGIVPALVPLLTSADVTIQEYAVTAVLNLALEPDLKKQIIAGGAVEPLVEALKNKERQKARETAAGALSSLSVSSEAREPIREAGAIAALLELLVTGSSRGRRDAAIGLFNLAIDATCRQGIVSEGCVQILLNELEDSESGMEDEAVSLLASLMKMPEACSIVQRESGIPKLVTVLDCASDKAKANAAACLYQLAAGDASSHQVMIQEGALLALRPLIQKGTPRGKEKALALLKLLQPERNMMHE